MIVVTGAAGFIGSVVVGHLNAAGYRDIVLVDRFDRPDHNANYITKQYRELVHRDAFVSWAEANGDDIEAIIHLGARTDTTEQRIEVFNALNLNYSKAVWGICARYQIPLIYASSAATYGNAEAGFSDDHSLIPSLKPQNPYGQSKQDFDVWVLAEAAAGRAPFFWAGLKFFNVYGPNEYHKGRMASVVFHATKQIRGSETGTMRLFKSHRPNIEDGHQQRDFIYVCDVARVIQYLMEVRPGTGAIFNLGTGRARTFLDLTHGVFRALGQTPRIEFIDTPNEIRESYQYYTQAEMGKLRAAGYSEPFTELEAGIDEYVARFLLNTTYL